MPFVILILMLTFFLKKDEDTTSSIWGDAPDKFGKWNCRCFVGAD